MISIFVIFIIILYIVRRPRIGENEPPLVPYKIPILGHTFSYLFNAKKFIKECKEQYGECFSIYVFGHVMTVVSRNSLSEVFRYPDNFDITSGLKEHLPLYLLFSYNGGMSNEGNKFHIKSVRKQISGKLDLNISVVQKYLSKGMEKWIGDCKHPKTVYDAWNMINNIIAIPIANVLVGEEAASHEDLVNSFGKFAFDLGPLLFIPPLLSFIHIKLHELFITLPLRFGWNPVSHHREVTMKRLRPVIEKRLKERNELGDNYKPYHDLLEYYMDQPNFDYTKPDNLPYHVENLLVIVFSSITTTSRAAADALYDLAGRPELLNELYEEALRIDRECNGSLTVADVKRMVKLDSFVKESLRHNGIITSLPHYVVKDYTFSSGLTVPKGRKLRLYFDDMLKAKESYGEDAEEFKPFRFLKANSPATLVERSYIVFGGGKHACPGRFFAVNEVKLFLHKLILKYKVSTQSGKIEDKIYFGPYSFPSKSGIVFENRV
ncbi:hypothetical protein RclHR1_01800003 [Rhizophagus clarus]|uniref:Cytochrome P450 n=1 Tax=Rhizophagus clarus TaxID=94130 RepID=A0A2Z6REK6_9GLOM|nr:hypothetical protein RclHR1_01800003 [Rhizophagus clarus]GES89109.1 cytochrome P450 [Rhizophagus clarus]